MKSFRINYLFSALLMAGSLLFASCSDDDEQPNPEQHTAQITFATPANHASFDSGEEVTISGTITSNMQIHGYKIVVHNTTTGADTVITEDHAHDSQLNFSANWTNDVTVHSDMEAEVIVTLDHDGKTASNKVHFHAMP